ncbi:TPA: hypothetical protein N0F65_012297 [Lagenidium giganteum]|uniref:Uncharacterized protein n=1 Tax=Lagenidium giganteum TaxID=4803 RepID=A0AAV2ZJ52_9STRA|nr:TPA: hypothetical protein N0F65_012297 [Lagenidium giganteum]
MGNGAGVQVPAEKANKAHGFSITALRNAEHGRPVITNATLLRAIRVAEQWYAIADQRVLSRVHRVVEEQVVRRIQLFMDHVEVTSKILYVKALSTATIASAYDIDIIDVKCVRVSKREYEVYNCGPELLNIPTLNKNAAPVLELQDPQVMAFLLTKCRWTLWHPPTSLRVKVDQVYDMAVHVYVRKLGFLTNEIRVVKLRIGNKWVGPNHHDTMPHASKRQWLHRTDYEVTGQKLSAESAFFQTVKSAYQDYLDELARLPREDLRSSDETGNGFAYDDQDQRTSLRIRYMLETALAQILTESRTYFRMAHQFEMWRMEQEDKIENRTFHEHHLAGPLLDGKLEELMEFYELQSMAMEDVPAIALATNVVQEKEEEDRTDP